MHLPRRSCVLRPGVSDDLLPWSLWLSLSDGKSFAGLENSFLPRPTPASPQAALTDRQNSGGQGGGNPNHGEGLSGGPPPSPSRALLQEGVDQSPGLPLPQPWQHYPAAGAASAHLSGLKRVEQLSLRNREHAGLRNQGPTFSLPVGSRAWGREGNSQGALPCSAVDWSPLKDETYPILPAEWSAQRPFEGKRRKTARSPPGLLSGERLPSNREMKRSRGWQRARRWGEADQTNFCYGISGEAEVKASFEMS